MSTTGFYSLFYEALVFVFATVYVTLRRIIYHVKYPFEDKCTLYSVHGDGTPKLSQPQSKNVGKVGPGDSLDNYYI